MATIQRRRVVITGMGTINPCGITVEATWNNLLQGNSGITVIDRFDTTGFSCKIAGQVKDFVLDKYVINRKEHKKMDIFIQYAIAAASEAITDSGLILSELSSTELEKFGVFIGSGIGGLSTILREANNYRGSQYISPFFIPSVIINLASGFVSIMFGLKGPSSAVVTACATGANAIGDAARQIMFGYADRMLAGGSDSVINPLGVGGFSAMKALSTRNNEPDKASRPFDVERDGFVMSEGAGVVMLEEYELAKARGAKIYAEVVGYGMSSDAYHIASPSLDGDGPMRAMRSAITDAGIVPDEISYVNAHGTSTPSGDKVECLALKKVFGNHIDTLKVSSTKSLTGHLLGAAGGLESIICCLIIKNGYIPPMINVINQDPGCDVNLITNRIENFSGEYILNNNFGFGGTNACLIFKRLSN